LRLTWEVEKWVSAKIDHGLYLHASQLPYTSYPPPLVQSPAPAGGPPQSNASASAGTGPASASPAGAATPLCLLTVTGRGGRVRLFHTHTLRHVTAITALPPTGAAAGTAAAAADLAGAAAAIGAIATRTAGADVRYYDAVDNTDPRFRRLLRKHAQEQQELLNGASGGGGAAAGDGADSRGAIGGVAPVRGGIDYRSSGRYVRRMERYEAKMRAAGFPHGPPTRASFVTLTVPAPKLPVCVTLRLSADGRSLAMHFADRSLLTVALTFPDAAYANGASSSATASANASGASLGHLSSRVGSGSTPRDAKGAATAKPFVPSVAFTGYRPAVRGSVSALRVSTVYPHNPAAESMAGFNYTARLQQRAAAADHPRAHAYAAELAAKLAAQGEPLAAQCAREQRGTLAVTVVGTEGVVRVFALRPSGAGHASDCERNYFPRSKEERDSGTYDPFPLTNKSKARTGGAGGAKPESDCERKVSDCEQLSPSLLQSQSEARFRRSVALGDREQAELRDQQWQQVSWGPIDPVPVDRVHALFAVRTGMLNQYSTPGT